MWSVALVSYSRHWVSRSTAIGYSDDYGPGTGPPLPGWPPRPTGTRHSRAAPLTDSRQRGLHQVLLPLQSRPLQLPHSLCCGHSLSSLSTSSQSAFILRLLFTCACPSHPSPAPAAHAAPAAAECD